MKTLKVLSSLILALSLFACTSNNGGEASNQLSFTNKAQAQRAFESVSLECAEKDLNCPESVAGISILTHDPLLEKPWNSQVCSGTLIGHNKVLTNDHCLGASQLKENASCNESIKIIFPKTKNKNAETINCAKIYKINTQININSQRPDWVILELQSSVQRKAADINLNGLKEGSSVHSFPVYYSKTENSFSGRVQKNECSTTMQHYYSTFYFHPQSAIIAAAQCSKNVVKGNSGAGYFNPNNELSFVGSFSVETEASKNEQTIYHFGKENIISNKFVGGTNIACIPSLTNDLSSYCYFSGSDKFKNLLIDSRPYFSKGPFDQKISQSIQKQQLDNNHIQWQKTDKDSVYYQETLKRFQEAYNPKQESALFEIKPIPEKILSYIALQVSQVKHPQTPRCIEPNYLSRHETEIPQLDQNSFDTEINEHGLIKHLLFYDPLRVTFKKTDSKHYEATLYRMSSAQQKEFIHLETQNFSNLVQCMQYKPEKKSNNPSASPNSQIPKPCQIYSSQRLVIKKWMEENHIDTYLRRNEITALSLGDQAFELTIPICE